MECLWALWLKTFVLGAWFFTNFLCAAIQNVHNKIMLIEKSIDKCCRFDRNGMQWNGERMQIADDNKQGEKAGYFCPVISQASWYLQTLRPRKHTGWSPGEESNTSCTYWTKYFLRESFWEFKPFSKTVIERNSLRRRIPRTKSLVSKIFQFIDRPFKARVSTQMMLADWSVGMDYLLPVTTPCVADDQSKQRYNSIVPESLLALPLWPKSQKTLGTRLSMIRHDYRPLLGKWGSAQ